MAEETTQNNDIQIDEAEALKQRFNLSDKLVLSGSAVPTYKPKTFSQQFYMYKNITGGVTTYRLYVYIDDAWMALQYVDGSLYIKKDGTIAFTGDQSMGNFKITALGNPTDDQDAATKAYVVNNFMNVYNLLSKYNTIKVDTKVEHFIIMLINF